MIYTHSIRWSNPYTQPPEKLPKTLVKIESTEHRLDGRLKDKFYAILDRLQAQDIWGYNVHWDFYNDKPRKGWTLEAKQRNRRNRLRKRLEKKFSIPGLLEQFYQEAINKKPDYYGVEPCQ